MDFQMADEAVKRALALGRKIEFIRKVSGISESQRQVLLKPLEDERKRILEGSGVSGVLDLQPAAAPAPAAPGAGGGKVK